MRLSQTKRAINERHRRTRARDQRRFNTLTSDFISVKYPDVYEEACQFYQSLNKRHPQKHNLTKTKEYKLWKTGIVNNQDSEDEHSEGGDNNLTESDGEIQSTEQAATMPTEQIDEGETTPESAQAAQNILQEASKGLNFANVDNFDSVDDIINEIIIDLQQDDVLREYLNAERNDEILRPHYEEEDEGIGLNVETELEAITEPFDYELEVELEEW